MECKNNGNNEKEDLFEYLARRLGCEYISDMTRGLYNQKARQVMAELDCSRYPLDVLNDVAEYLYGKKHCFETVGEATRFFRSMANIRLEGTSPEEKKYD